MEANFGQLYKRRWPAVIYSGCCTYPTDKQEFVQRADMQESLISFPSHTWSAKKCDLFLINLGSQGDESMKYERLKLDWIVGYISGLFLSSEFAKIFQFTLEERCHSNRKCDVFTYFSELAYLGGTSPVYSGYLHCFQMLWSLYLCHYLQFWNINISVVLSSFPEKNSKLLLFLQVKDRKSFHIITSVVNFTFCSFYSKWKQKIIINNTEEKLLATDKLK